jgi:hypothetical protein
MVYVACGAHVAKRELLALLMLLLLAAAIANGGVEPLKELRIPFSPSVLGVRA